jgi:hypothetical protein
MGGPEGQGIIASPRRPKTPWHATRGGPRAIKPGPPAAFALQHVRSLWEKFATASGFVPALPPENRRVIA